VHQIQESVVRAITLERSADGRAYTFVNTGGNVWSPEGEPIRAPEAFVSALDSLLNLGALAWVPEPDEKELLLSVRLRLEPGTEGTPEAFTFARTSDGSTLCLTSAGQAATIDGALVEKLLGLF
jgi:hypothetical protein